MTFKHRTNHQATLWATSLLIIGLLLTGTINVAGQNSTLPAAAQPNPTPAITTINPNSVAAGGAAFTLTVNGTGFINGSTVRVNGANRTTAFVSATQLTAQIPATDIATAGAARITVFNPAPGGGVSNEVTLTVGNAVTSVSAASFLASLGLAPESIVSAFGVRLATTTQAATSLPLPTSIAGTMVRVRDNAGTERTAPLFFVAPGQINFQLPSGVANGPATVTVTSGDGSVSVGTMPVATVAPGVFAANANGQGPAAGVALRVNNANPVPVISGLSPVSIVAGNQSFTLIINGSGFVRQSAVRWNGEARTTTFVSATQLRAAIPASDLTATGVAAITVFNPEPGGGESNRVNFAINNPTPTITSLSHGFTTSGEPGFTLTINGSNFLAESVGRWNGADRVTIFVSRSQLRMEVLASDLAAPGTGSVTVFNPPPGGGSSSARTITIFDGANDVRLTSGTAFQGNFSAPPPNTPPGACSIRIFPQYTIQVPPGATQLQIALTSSEDLDIFARFAQRVDITNTLIADYRSTGLTGNETITVTPSSVPPLQGGKYFIAVASCARVAATFTLTATVTGGLAATDPPVVSEAQTDSPEPGEENVEMEDDDPVVVCIPKPTEPEPDAIAIAIPPSLEGQDQSLAPDSVEATAEEASDQSSRDQAAIPAQGQQSFEPIVRFDAAQNRFVAVPIDLGPAAHDMFLILYGTGIRFRPSLTGVTASIGGVNVPVMFAGSAPGLIGLDQINLGPLPRSLAGRGEVDVVLIVDGKTANTIRISIR